MLDLDEVVEWDIATWSRAVRYWEGVIGDQRPTRGLELGARNGGLSCFFAERFGCEMVCTDVELGSSKELHSRRGVSHLISHEIVNAVDIPFDDRSFEFVVFKSILGAVGARGQREKQRVAMQEIHRVLKPGGQLLFAENLKGSKLHQWARSAFVPWGKTWTYLEAEEIAQLLQPFSEQEIHCTGFSSAFVKGPEKLRSVFASLDQSVLGWIPDKWRYVAYGHATK